MVKDSRLTSKRKRWGTIACRKSSGRGHSGYAPSRCKSTVVMAKAKLLEIQSPGGPASPVSSLHL